jgi:D-3-phosphoglycerate dehydrogenase
MVGIAIEAELAGEMIYIVNEDAPGFIGRLGTMLGAAGLNIATFHLGRREAGGEAVALVSVDGHIGPDLVEALESLPGVRKVKPLRF